ncbi:30S ribosomal protein S11 [Striga asiatica]|uniref:30S ribosomal protein S11 n=1 Tax=Striga asiatica TaxID=4170 RepID=A0A5A7RHV6_STRAF|nr:30S ribosomal protein S11 [Striga asiatica]
MPRELAVAHVVPDSPEAVYFALAAVCALSAAICAAYLPWKEEETANIVTVSVFPIVLCLANLAWWVRERDLGLRRRDWKADAVGVVVAAGINTVMAAIPDQSDNRIVWQAAAAFSVFIFVELLQPHTDFGISQGFILTAFQTSVICNFSVWYVVTAILLVVVIFRHSRLTYVPPPDAVHFSLSYAVAALLVAVVAVMGLMASSFRRPDLGPLGFAAT